MKYKNKLFIVLQIIFIVLTFSLSAWCQESSLIVQVNDQFLNEPLSSALVVIRNTNGEIKSGSTNKAGQVIFKDLRFESYRATINYVGYEKVTDTLIKISKPGAEKIVIFLKPHIEDLKQVEIKSHKQYIIMNKGKITLTLENSPLGKATDVWNILKYAPSVETSITGKLTIKNQTTTVFVDGRRIYLSGIDLMNYLKSIAPVNIQNIEIISHPGVAYPSDVQTVINIKSKKNQQDGIKNFTSATGSKGIHYRYMLTDNIIYNRGPFNLQVNFNHHESDLQEKKIINTINQPDNIWETNQITNTLQKQNRISANITYNSAKNTVISFYTELNPGISRISTNSNNGDPTQERIEARDSIFQFLSKINMKSSSHLMQTSLETKWDSTRQSFKIQAEYFGNPRKLSNNYNTSNFSKGMFVNTKNLSDSLPQKIKTIVGSIEYRRGLFFGELTLGTRLSNTNLINHNKTFSYIDNRVVSQSDLNYDENNYAGFIDWSKQFKNTYISLGNRLENLDIKINNYDGHESVKFHLFSYLPSFLFQQKLDATNVIEISYKKNVIKPDYFQLNSYKRYNGNSLVYFQGKDDIQPQVNNTFDLTWTQSNGIIISTGFVLMKNLISTLYVKDSQNVLYEQYTNFSNTRALYLNASYVKTFRDFWQIRLNGNSFFINGTELQDIIRVKSTPSVNLAYINSLTLPKNWVVETALVWNNKFKDGFFEHGSTSSGQLAVQKNMPKQNLTITLSGSLRFGTDQSNRALYNNIYYKDRTYSDSNVASINISWNIGKLSVKNVAKQKSESDESKQRIKDRN
ncbi:outer membrane beta-barrel protein [Pedobacter sp. WC2423]|uniref:outer membrane beta-barrel protein n=1 Tax=Pedobacter sp. WC2423 TaxID=3234142 RepID=UPI00346545CA